MLGIFLTADDRGCPILRAFCEGWEEQNFDADCPRPTLCKGAKDGAPTFVTGKKVHEKRQVRRDQEESPKRMHLRGGRLVVVGYV